MEGICSSIIIVSTRAYHETKHSYPRNGPLPSPRPPKKDLGPSLPFVCLQSIEGPELLAPEAFSDLWRRVFSTTVRPSRQLPVNATASHSVEWNIVG